MSLIKWNDKSLSTGRTKFLHDFFNDDMRFAPFRDAISFPTTNIEETDESFLLDLAVPGMEKGDFNIEIADGILTVSSQKEENEEDINKNYTRKEYNYHSFRRSFMLPENVKEEDIKANYDKGILKLTMPKKEVEVKPKKIRIA